MRGKKYDTETKERALAALAVSNNIDELSRELKIPVSYTHLDGERMALPGLAD